MRAGALAMVMLVLAIGAGDAGAAAPGSQSPPGANNWSCKPSAAHPNPVVLVHGLGATMSENWSQMSPFLAGNGYCVFALTYGQDARAPWFGGVVPMEQSSQQLSAFVDRVLTATGAEKVDIVGHSEGSLMPDWYVKFLGGAAKVDRYMGMTPLWDGTNIAGVGAACDIGRQNGSCQAVSSVVARYCGSCPEFVRGSDFLAKLNAGGAAVPGVTYTMLLTRYDELVWPYTSGLLDGATNIVVQDECPNDFSEHGAMAFDPVVRQLVVNALDPEHARPPDC